MSVKYKLTENGTTMSLELMGDLGASFDDYVETIDEVRDKLANSQCKTLQTFVKSDHKSELEFFLGNDFYIDEVMLMMEYDLSESIPVADAETACQFLLYDVNERGLKEYMQVLKKGFGTVAPSEKQILDLLSQNEARIYTAEISGKIVSSVMVWNLDGDKVATENIVTLPKYRGMHVSKALLAYVLSEMTREGKRVARLSVSGGIGEAYRYYLDFGYQLKESYYKLMYWDE